MEYNEVIAQLKSLAKPENIAGMARFGINPDNTLGIFIYELRKIAKKIGVDHKLAQKLWKSGIHEARLLAGFIDDAEMVTEKQMEDWVKDFDSWDICDQVCSNLFDKTEFAYKKAFEWSERAEEFVKRAGFVLMAALAVHDKEASDEKIMEFLPIIMREVGDDRNYVKKAINWALRQIGKRNRNLNAKAIETAEEIKKIKLKSARWIASDAIRELTSEKVQEKLRTHDLDNLPKEKRLDSCFRRNDIV